MRVGAALPWLAGLASLVTLPGASAWASDYCPDRPGLDTPPCTVDRGHLSAEMSLADWTHDSDENAVADTLLLGDLALRFGVGNRTEARFAWTPYGSVRVRDRASGLVARARSTGDITLGIKQNVLDPGGERLSIAVLPSLSLPVGGEAIGAGTWSAHLQVPMSLAAGHGVSFLLTPELDAAANADGSGRHLAYGAAGGIGFSPASHVNIAIEASAIRDQEPGEATTIELAAASVGFALATNFQADVGAQFGLNRNSPDRRLSIGIARRF